MWIFLLLCFILLAAGNVVAVLLPLTKLISMIFRIDFHFPQFISYVIFSSLLLQTSAHKHIINACVWVCSWGSLRIFLCHDLINVRIAVKLSGNSKCIAY